MTLCVVFWLSTQPSSLISKFTRLFSYETKELSTVQPSLSVISLTISSCMSEWQKKQDSEGEQKEELWICSLSNPWFVSQTVPEISSPRSAKVALKLCLAGTVLMMGCCLMWLMLGVMGVWSTCCCVMQRKSRKGMACWKAIRRVLQKYLSMKWFILLAVLVALTTAADEGDWVDPFLLPVPFAIRAFYAGYLNISEQKAIYYVYTPSENNPSKDPLVVLLSTGPGCSILHSWLYSKGEFVFTRNTTSFRHNPYNWNRRANVLYLQGPAGVGFSYGADSVTTDDSTQQEYFRALLRFYQKFPELKDQPMYLSGYGYAGITAPKLALNIINHNRNESTPSWLRMNINGTLLFNPCTLYEQCDSNFQFNTFTVQALRNNYFISRQTYEDYRTHCTLRTSACQKAEKKIESDFAVTGADIFNIYKECLHQPGDISCIDHTGIDTFLNVDTVKEDLNADKSRKWDLCNGTMLEKYVRDDEGSLKTYETLLRAEHNMRIWIVSGSQSARVPTLGTKKWVDEVKLNLGLPHTRLWEPWFYQTVNAGEIESIPGLSFITIRSAGFFMFEDQPEIANYLYQSYLDGKPL